MTLRENNTHEAIKNVINGKIDIYIKGMTFEDGFCFAPEYLYSIDGSEEEDLQCIFEGFEEQNKINLSEARNEFL